MPRKVAGQAPIDDRNHLWPRPFAAGLLLLAIVAAIVLAGGPDAEPEAASAFKSRANIIVLLTDDQETASMRIMKTVNKEMKRKGVTMKRFYDNFPLCCPSRTTLLTGQYAHNHQVLSNKAPDGGYGVFNELHGDNNLALWLQAAGYRTAYIGKFLNEYAEPDEYGTLPIDVPRGWNDWRVLAPSRAQYFGYTLNQNGSLVQFSEAEKDYSTDIFTTKAKRFIRQSAKAPNPFFLTLGYAAPHGGGGGEPGRSCNRAAVPAPRHLGTLKDELKGNLPASFNEADVSDKPSPVAERAPLTPGQISDILRKRRCAWESLLAVDESVGEILDELRRDKLRNDTYVFFLSDNGLLRGEHRIRSDKRFLYEESSRVPFIARGPHLPRGEQSSDVVVNADLTATVLEISGAGPGLTQDGQSLLPSLENPELERGRAILFEAFAGDEIFGVRTSKYVYSEWDTPAQQAPERELYDTDADPYQLTNLANDPFYSAVVADLSDQLDHLRQCRGADCASAPAGSIAIGGGGAGKNGCRLAPVIASFTSPQQDEIVAVSFEVNKALVAEDTVAPFEAEIPTATLRKALPKPGTVVASALFADGRRVALPANVRACK